MNVGFYLKKMHERVKPVLKGDEKIVLMFRQSLISNIAPTFIVATDQRLIVINNSFWGLYSGINLLTTTDYNYIPYDKITGVVLMKGKLLSTLNIRLLGAFESNISPKKKTEGEIDGLTQNNAIILEQFIEQEVKKLESRKAGEVHGPQAYKSGSFKF
ncbi:MAG: PH domain-containing protein [Candidatus Micrarchaeaceae archaeon]